MDDAIQLIEAFVNGHISANTFVDHYLPLWEELREENKRALQNNPRLVAQEEALEQRFRAGQIALDEYWAELEGIGRQLNTRLLPGSKQSRLIDQLFVASDAFNEDLKAQHPEQFLDGEELWASARDVLAAMQQL
jgi:hypothetical protein